SAEGALIEARGASGVPVYLLEHEHYYNRDSLYGTADGDYWDNCERFVFFCRAALEALARLEAPGSGVRWQPQVIHANDWQTGLLPVYLRTLYRDHPVVGNLASVFTIHNLAYQGVFWHYDMPMTGLGWDLFTPAGIEFYGKLNFLKGALVFSDLLTTVSRTYAREIRTAEFGNGLEGVLEDRSHDLHGVVNGIDYDVWNPQKDAAIAHPYSADDTEPKAICPAALRGALACVLGRGGEAPRGRLPRRGSRAPGTGRGPHRIRRRSVPTHLRGQRRVPDALALRAVRARAAHRPPLRNRPHRAAHGGAGRHRDRVRSGPPHRHRLRVRRVHRRGPGRRGAPGRVHIPAPVSGQGAIPKCEV